MDIDEEEIKSALADLDIDPSHRCLPEIRHFSCYQCSCGDVYSPTDIRRLIKRVPSVNTKKKRIILKRSLLCSS